MATKTSQGEAKIAAVPVPLGSFDDLAKFSDASWVRELNADPDTAANAPNRTSRQVKSGHYVLVRPTPLPQPRLVHTSSKFLSEIGLTTEHAQSEAFLRFFSGDIPIPREPGAWGVTWATPYALSIYGQEMYDNCPFKNGNGYGDGRAISVLEVTLPNGRRWEFQLKGAGPTPFCRGADGRAVLRSSVREFLVSEAMHEMGISTTRAISLIASSQATVRRPWYSNDAANDDITIPDMDDPRLAHVPPEYRKYLLQQLIMQHRNPDRMQDEICAITCRVATSFVRVGHIELFARRVRKMKAAGAHNENIIHEMELIVDHLIQREYSSIDQSASRSARILQMLELAGKRIAELTTGWIRVGFCQGNFNSDNCLAGGRTMDYGPFGFIEKFDPLWNMWVGGGEHFSFMNQPVAGGKNFQTLVNACSVLLEGEDKQRASAIADQYKTMSKAQLLLVFKRKLGLAGANVEETEVQQLADSLLAIMEATKADWTMMWRQLAHVAAIPDAATKPSSANAEELLAPLQDVFFAPLVAQGKQSLLKWLHRWVAALDASGMARDDIVATMRQASPKYVPREWMLVNAYTAANRGDYSLVKELHTLFEDPYGEQAGMDAKYYRKTPAATYAGVGVGGTSFMS